MQKVPFLHTGKILNMQNPYGAIIRPMPVGAPVYDDIFTGTEQPINWKEYLPPRERQYNTPFCVTFSCLNCQEAVARKESIELNLSDRYLGVISKTTKQGNDLHTVAEMFRTQGVVKETDCPWRDNWLTDLKYWNNVFDLSDVPQDSRKYKGGDHSFILDKKLVPRALHYSPIQLAVGIGSNWETETVIKNPAKIIAYHAVTCYDINEEGYFFQDSIGKEFKQLSPDYRIEAAKSFRLLPSNWRETQMKIVKTSDSDKLYILQGSKAIHVFSMATLEVLGLLDLPIEIISADDLKKYQQETIGLLK